MNQLSLNFILKFHSLKVLTLFKVNLLGINPTNNYKASVKHLKYNKSFELSIDSLNLQ